MTKLTKALSSRQNAVGMGRLTESKGNILSRTLNMVTTQTQNKSLRYCWSTKEAVESKEREQQQQSKTQELVRRLIGGSFLICLTLSIYLGSVVYYLFFCAGRNQRSETAAGQEQKPPATRPTTKVLNKVSWKDYKEMQVYRASQNNAKACCAICLSTFQDTDTASFNPACSHAFHTGCIDKWLEGHNDCPYCRTGWSVERGGVKEKANTDKGYDKTERQLVLYNTPRRTK